MRDKETNLGFFLICFVLLFANCSNKNTIQLVYNQRLTYDQIVLINEYIRHQLGKDVKIGSGSHGNETAMVFDVFLEKQLVADRLSILNLTEDKKIWRANLSSEFEEEIKVILELPHSDAKGVLNQ